MRLYCSILLLLASALPAQAEPKVVRLTAQPAAAPVPALKYQLLPELRDLHPGNAALLYQRAHAAEWFGSFRRQPDYNKMGDWLELADDKVPWKRVQALLPVNALKEVDLAARREYCDWEITDHLRKDGFYFLIPDVQGFREYGMFLAHRARLEMHEGRLDKAVYTFQTGLALSRHTGDGPILITGLVGMALAHTTLDQVERLIQLKAAPNLYWALSDLPRPLIDLRKSFQGERIAVDGTFPELRAELTNPHKGPLSSRQLQDTIHKLREVMAMSGDGQDLPSGVFVAVAAAKIYPQAKEHLGRRGFTPEQLNALPVVEAAVLYALAEYDRHFDEMAKWVNLPYWEARPGVIRAIESLKSSKARLMETGGIPLAEILIPAAQRVVLARARLDRRIAALRCIEALRLYAAAHDDALPTALEYVKEVPIPLDPITGKSFDYRLEDGKAVLSGPPPPGEQASENNSVRYELTLRK
jgi:hypothetical protein